MMFEHDYCSFNTLQHVKDHPQVENYINTRFK